MSTYLGTCLSVCKMQEQEEAGTRIHPRKYLPLMRHRESLQRQRDACGDRHWGRALWSLMCFMTQVSYQCRQSLGFLYSKLSFLNILFQNNLNMQINNYYLKLRKLYKTSTNLHVFLRLKEKNYKSTSVLLKTSKIFPNCFVNFIYIIIIIIIK